VTAALLIGLLAGVEQAAGGSPPADYSVEERLYWTVGAHPGSLVRIHVSGERMRMETSVGGAPIRTTILRPDRGTGYLLDDVRKTYQEMPLAALREKGGRPFQTLAGYQEEERRGVLRLTRVRREKIRGEVCDKYTLTYVKSESSFHLWVSAATGLPVLWVPEGEAEGPDAESRIEWTNLKVGPQPGHLFEVPADYRKVAPSQ
jgi:hypothetical protein